jgi:chromosome segregation ATPase
MGCGSIKSENVQSKIGIIDFEKARGGHPEYQNLSRLKEKLAALELQREGLIAASFKADSAKLKQDPDNFSKEQYESKLAAKQTEIRKQMESKANSLQTEIGNELKNYSTELDKSYYLQLFNLQLKLKTLQLPADEFEKIKQEMEGLQAEKTAKLKARQQELEDKYHTAMQAEEVKSKSELDSYAADLNVSLAQQREIFDKQQAERKEILNEPLTKDDQLTATREQISALQQQIKDLQEKIDNDIKSQGIRLAVEQSLGVVLTGVEVNIRAIDLTDNLINSLKNY